MTADQPGDPVKRIFVNVGAIVCWGLLWWLTTIGGMELGKRWVGREGLDGYLALTALLGFIVITPIGFACSTVFLWWKRNLALFLLSAVFVGLAITLWPLLEWVFPWLTW